MKCHKHLLCGTLHLFAEQGQCQTCLATGQVYFCSGVVKAEEEERAADEPDAILAEPIRVEVSLPEPTRFSSLQDAQEYLRQNVRRGTMCPCCGGSAKIWKRPLNSTMARGMILLYRLSPTPSPWIHFNREIGRKINCGEYGLLPWWGLTERKEGKRADGNPNSGYYRITEVGRAFTEDRLRISRYIYLYNDALLDRQEDGDGTTSIREALGKNFNYDELMQA
jgi:hypothetical protein